MGKKAKLRVGPLVDPEQINKARKYQNNLNRQRGKAMEKRITKLLRGDRTPMSGAGYTKGDCLVQLVYQPGRYIVECKYSALTEGGKADVMLENGVIPTIRLEFKWLSKLQQETQAMRARFGILVIHYHNTKEDWVFIRTEDLSILDSIARGNREDMIESNIFSLCYVENNNPLLATHTANGEPRAGYNLSRHKLIEHANNPYRAGVIYTTVGIYLYMRLTDFIELLGNK